MGSIKDIKDAYKGERAFILGNGPSLSEVPLSHLNNEYSFGMNKINKIYDSTSWRPSFYHCSMSVSHPEYPIEQIKENIDHGITCILNSDLSTVLGQRKNVHYMSIESLFSSKFHGLSHNEVQSIDIDQLSRYWSDNIHNKMYHYHTMYGVMQTAVYMGFKELYLLGCDLGLEYKNPHMIYADALDPHRFKGGKISFIKSSFDSGLPIKSIINGLALLFINKAYVSKILSSFYSYTSKEHFSESYLKSFRVHDGEKAEREIVKSHIAAKRICEMKGVKVFNLTPSGGLDVYPRKDLASVLN